MKLIRFGKEGKEKPGIHLEGKNYDLSAFIKDYDESFFEQNGLQKLAGIVNEEKLPDDLARKNKFINFSHFLFEYHISS